MNARALPGRLAAGVLAWAALLAPASAQSTLTTMGRLFMTPGERIQLDQQRATAALQPGGSAGGAAAAAPAGPAPMPGMSAPDSAAAAPLAPPPAPVRLDGILRRSNGRATIWVDNAPRETTVGGRATPAVPVDIDGRRVLLKPGQSYDPASGTVTDAQTTR